MDPDCNLEIIISALFSLCNHESRPNSDQVEELADILNEHIEALRGWLYLGGFQPSFKDAIERVFGTNATGLFE